jgi:hypothetical protein
MIDVGVAENDRIDLVGVERKVAIPLSSFLPASLVQPTIQQDFVVSNFQKVHRSRHTPSRAPERQRRLGRSQGMRFSEFHTDILTADGKSCSVGCEWNEMEW